MAQGTTSIGTKLNHVALNGEGKVPATGFTKLVGVRSTSAKGDAPEQIENTELDERRKSYLAGLEDTPNQTYTYNHTPDNFAAVVAICGERHAFLETFASGDGYVIVGVGATWHNGNSAPGTLGENTLEIICEDIYYVDEAQVTALLGA